MLWGTAEGQESYGGFDFVCTPLNKWPEAGYFEPPDTDLILCELFDETDSELNGENEEHLNRKAEQLIKLCESDIYGKIFLVAINLKTTNSHLGPNKNLVLDCIAPTQYSKLSDIPMMPSAEEFIKSQALFGNRLWQVYQEDHGKVVQDLFGIKSEGLIDSEDLQIKKSIVSWISSQDRSMKLLSELKKGSPVVWNNLKDHFPDDSAVASTILGDYGF